MSSVGLRLCFLTSTPLNVLNGSGTYTGISTLATALRSLGVEIEIIDCKSRVRPYALRRWLFNRRLARCSYHDFDAVIGFDLDGFLIREPRVPQLACIKGVVADELRFESGLTRKSLRIQAGWERRNVRHVAGVITTS